MSASLDSNRFIDHLLFRALKGDVTSAEEEKVMEWRRDAPENEAHFRQLGRLLQLTASAYHDEPDELPAPDTVRQLGTDVVRTGVTPRRFAWRWVAAASVAIAAVITVLVLSVPDSRQQGLLSLGVDEFVTGSSEAATVQLRDGTVVRLAPDSRLRLTGSANQREVTLDGRAFFAVAKMKGTRFVVRTRNGDAVVLGTRFEADTRGGQLRVLVIEGRVALTTGGTRVEVKANQLARASQGALSAPIHVANPERLLYWMGDILIFQATPMSEVASELERRFGIHVRLVGNVGTESVTAWFANPTADGVLRVVCTVIGATCTIEEDQAVIELSTPRL